MRLAAIFLVIVFLANECAALLPMDQLQHDLSRQQTLSH